MQGPFNLEFLSVCVKFRTYKCCIGLFYCPPSSPVEVMDNLFSVLELFVISYWGEPERAPH